MILEDLSTEDAQRYFELYMNHCTQHNEHPSVKDFTIWFQENYG